MKLRKDWLENLKTITNQLVVHFHHSLCEANQSCVSEVVDLIDSETFKEHWKAEQRKWNALFKTIANSRR
ncbi:hypothetical protein [Gallibacterium anatis]